MFTREQAYEESLNYFNGDKLATEVFISKYCLRDNKGNFYEKTPDDMHRRLAKEFARIEAKYKNPMDEEEIFSLLEHFKYIIPQGSPMFGVGNNFVITSLSNCFVVGNNDEADSYGSIFRTDEEIAQIYKRRGGCGVDLSHYRPSGSLNNNSILGEDCGATLYMERFSNTTREVSQNGRRGALMETISIHHPDTEKFIDKKLETGKVTGANISVRITDEFMNAVINDSYFIQTFPVDIPDSEFSNEFPETDKLPIDKLVVGVNGKVYCRKIKAKKLWDKIIFNAWKSAEPGVLFWDKIISESPADFYSDEGFKTISTNPCFTGETMIAIADGRNGVTIKQLAEESKGEIKFPVYSGRVGNTSGNRKGGFKPEIKLATAFKTGKKKVIEIVLSDNSSFRCTENHLLALPNGEYVEAKDSLHCELEKFFTFSDKNVYFDEKVYVTEIIDLNIEEDVFDLNVEDNHNFYILTKTDDNNFLNSSGILVHNCGELPLCEYDSCRLLLLNLFSYVQNPFEVDAYFDFNLFFDHSIKAQRLMDDLVDLEIEKIELIINKINNDPESTEIKLVELNLWNKILNKCKTGRRTGLGITAMGDMLAALGLIYGTDEATEFSKKVIKRLAINSYGSSVDLADERGSFPIWDSGEIINKFISRIINDSGFDFNEYFIHGRRNISNLTIAPAGSVSILAQTTSGIEPVFMPFYKRRRKIESSDKSVYKDSVGDHWEEYNVIHPKFIEWFDKNWFKLDNKWFDLDFKPDLESMNEETLNKVYEKSPYYKASSNDVNWLEKVRMQGAIQKWIDHSISVTVNIPENTPIEVVNDIYLQAYISGCKGCTIYRDKSREGVLINNSSEKSEEFIYKDAVKRPKELDCDIFTKTALGKEYTVLVGLVEGKPYEIFAFEQLPQTDFPKEIKRGILSKVKGQYYRLSGKRNEKEFIVDNIINCMDFDEKTNTRRYSLQLRHGIHPKFIVEQISKYANVSSFDKVIERVLKTYLVDDDIRAKCPNCGEKLTFEGGCNICKNCGWSACS